MISMPGSNLAASIPFVSMGKMTFLGKVSSLYINEYFGIIVLKIDNEYSYILISNPIKSYLTLDKLIYDNLLKNKIKNLYGNKG